MTICGFFKRFVLFFKKMYEVFFSLSLKMFIRISLFRVSYFALWMHLMSDAEKKRKKISNTMLNQAFSDCLLNDSVHHRAINHQTNHHHIKHIIITNIIKCWDGTSIIKVNIMQSSVVVVFFCSKVTKNC